MMTPTSLPSLAQLAMSTSLALSVGVAPLATASAHAGPAADGTEPTADDLSDQAVAKFEAREYDAAAKLFEEAYRIDPNPNYLFNIGRVYEEKGDLRHAVEFYQRFLGESGVDLESRQAATERLKVLREAIKELEPNEPPPREIPAEAEGTDTDVDPTGSDSGADDDPSADARKRKLRIAGYSLMGVGGVALIAGGVVGGIALGASNDAEDGEFVDETMRLRDKAKTQANVADGLFISGGVLAAVGLVLVLTTLGKGKGKADAKVARTQWAPMVGLGRSSTLGLGMTRRF